MLKWSGRPPARLSGSKQCSHLHAVKFSQSLCRTQQLPAGNVQPRHSSSLDCLQIITGFCLQWQPTKQIKNLTGLFSPYQLLHSNQNKAMQKIAIVSHTRPKPETPSFTKTKYNSKAFAHTGPIIISPHTTVFGKIFAF